MTTSPPNESNKGNAVYLYNGMLFSHKQGQSAEITWIKLETFC